jgi:hypothetical protein
MYTMNRPKKCPVRLGRNPAIMYCTGKIKAPPKKINLEKKMVTLAPTPQRSAPIHPARQSSELFKTTKKIRNVDPKLNKHETNNKDVSGARPNREETFPTMWWYNTG